MFWFQARDGTTLYMGRDKHENEDLIAHGWPEDVWFHVDDMSSAHVYLRLQPGQSMDDISGEAMEDCCQLVKANSIKGCKLKQVRIVYTPWSNLLKEERMEVGAVGFRESKLRRFRMVSKDKELVKRLNKSKREEESPDLPGMRRARDAAQRQQDKAALKARRKREKEELAAAKADARLKSYADLFEGEGGAAGGGGGGGLDDDDDAWDEAEGAGDCDGPVDPEFDDFM